MDMTLLAGMVVVSIVLVIYSFWPSDKSEADAVKRRMAGRSAQENLKAVREKAKESVAKRVIEKVAPIAIHSGMMANSEGLSRLRLKLAMAGIRSDNASTIFLTSKTLVAVLLGIAGLFYAWAKGMPLGSGAGVTMIGAALGFMAPDYWLRSAIKKRGQQIRMGLPDTLDMLVISVEAGLGLDAALQRVGDEMGQVHPILAEELKLVTLESQMGIPRSESLDNFATRTGIDETRSMVGVVNQAERFGTSIARALRRQSDALRVKRRQAAEEKAQQTTVKLMLPLIMFIFPAIFVVLGGPAALTMMEALKTSNLG